VRTAAVAFVASTLTGAVATPAVRHLAHRWGALDHALTSRKIHGKPIPRLGGIAIVLAFYAPLVALFFVNTAAGARFYASPQRAIGLFVGGALIAALGILDDLRGANARTKFLVQFGVAALMYWLGFRVERIANPFGNAVDLGYLALPFTMLWIAGVINAMNLIDGLDGLAGGVAFIAITCTFVLALHFDRPLMLLFMAALGGAVLGFLFYNFNPATIFMGDTGSMFLGFVIATTSIQTSQKSSTAVAILVPILALGVPIADTLLAMMRRAARGAPLFSADRGHIHHRLLDLGLSHRRTVLVIYAASIVLGLSALALTWASSSQAMWFLLALSAVAYLALRKLGFISLSKAQAVLADRRRNLEVRAAIRRVGEALAGAETLRDMWEGARTGASALGATAVALRLKSADAWAEGFDAEAEILSARYGLMPERPGEAQLELGWDDGRELVDRDTEIAIELLCDHLSSALERIDRAGLMRLQLVANK
jgi:UDP-GlcNAc:undecaprenyl-phosphate/decaprenyl-phosphate GlcNAc-1-phosphate transferase